MNKFNKTPTEVVTFGVDFQAWLGSETIASIAVTSINVDTLADTTATILATTAISSGVVKFTTQNGSHGQNHKIRMLVTSSGSQIFESNCYLEIATF